MLSFDHPFLSFIFNSPWFCPGPLRFLSWRQTLLCQEFLYSQLSLCHSQILCPLQCTCCLYPFSKAVPSVSLRLSPTATSRYLYYPRTSGCCPFLFSEAVWVSMSTHVTRPVCPVLCGLFLRLSPHSAPRAPGATPRGRRAPPSSLELPSLTPEPGLPASHPPGSPVEVLSAPPTQAVHEGPIFSLP